MGRSWAGQDTSEHTGRAGVIAGRYTLVSEVGRGGMGVVWRGVDEVLERDVALKRVGMSPGGVSPDLARAEREARLAASLNHPNVVAVFDLVTEGDEQWLVMEYVENRTLAQLVREQGPLSPDEAARLLHQSASALAAAHRAGIVHRDVKPSNILVTPTGQVKLTDFGIARAHADATLTATGLMSGSPAYLSPEVASGSTATQASDVWALGATLFHALTGRPPYEVGDNVMGALYQIVHTDPPRPENAGWLLPLLESTMTKDPEDRWSMAEVRDFLARGVPERVPPAPTRTLLAAPEPAESTSLLAAAATAPTPAPAVPPTTVPPPAPASGDEESRRSPRWILPVLIAAAILAVIGLGLWALSPGDGQRPDSAAEKPQASGSSSPSPSQGSSATPSETPSETTSPSTTATADGMASFVEGYLKTVTKDPDQTWTELTPDFQDASGGLDAYKGFWSTIKSAKVDDITADPASMNVSYTVTYKKTDGSVVTEDNSLGLVMDGDQYYIASEG